MPSKLYAPFGVTMRLIPSLHGTWWIDMKPTPLRRLNPSRRLMRDYGRAWTATNVCRLIERAVCIACVCAIGVMLARACVPV
jgi:hypothetical protein